MITIPEGAALDHALIDPVTWADETRIHAYLTWLRANDPVRLMTPEGYEPFYAITKHADVMAIEQSGGFRGHYFVLMGHLSPIDGIGPEQLGLDTLCARFDEGVVEEVILATNPTVEGEATAYFISQKAKDAKVRVTRIAHGVPLGGELEYTDSSTLAHALSGRTVVGE